jgi:pyruvate/2-oxoglutarate dehydrogenase complex dihydrolipoamide acyltransferase (E2) component
VKKIIVLGAGAVGAVGASMALFGTGVAAADDYAGQTYSDASSAASDAGQTVTIASRVGSLPDDQCMVTRSQTAPFLESDFVTHTSGSVQFYLNCAGAYATATTSGASVASPEGRAAKSAADEAAAEAAAQQNESDELLAAGDEPGATTPDVASG